MSTTNLLTASQAAAALGMYRTAVHKAIYAGRLKAEKVGGLYMITRAEVDRYRRETNPAGGRPKKLRGPARQE